MACPQTVPPSIPPWARPKSQTASCRCDEPPPQSPPWQGGEQEGAAIVDVTGDDGLDVAFGSDDGILRALRGHDGGVVWTYDLQAHYGKTFEMDHAPVIADFDGDGDLDIFIVGGYTNSSDSTLNHGRAYAVTAGTGSGPGWPLFRHDAYHSGCYTVEEEPIPAVSVWGLVAMALLGLTAGTLLFRRSPPHML